MTPITVSKNHEIHRAGFIVIDAATIIENGMIEIENGIIKDIYPGQTGRADFDHGPGVIMAPLVNAHLHLELSALENKILASNNFLAWVQDVLKHRQAISEPELIRAGKDQASLLFNSGNLYIGDISTLLIGPRMTENSQLKGLCFNEYLGTKLPDLWSEEKNGPLPCSFAGHAPHTTAPGILNKLKRKAKLLNRPFSIHVAESDDETRFIREKKGPWAQFLISRGINDWHTWGIGNLSPVSYLEKKGILGPGTLAVHLLNTDKDDLERIAQSKTRVCICPRSNFNLHKKLPDIRQMLKMGIRPALGTDSLASCDTLNIKDEMRFIHKKYPQIRFEDIFSMATVNGARALGMETVTGTLHPGKKADFIYHEPANLTLKTLLEKIITNA